MRASLGGVVDLRDPRATDPTVAGSKAAALSRAARTGLAVLPGFVVADGEPADSDAVRRAWAGLASGGGVLVVRSSSAAEDTSTSSMAGRFVSIGDVGGWEPFLAAVETVRRSAGAAPGSSMAVLVQPSLEPVRGGVLFGLDPVTGARNRLVVECCAGSPRAIVGGDVTATRTVLSPRGRVLEREPAGDRTLGRRDRRRLARLARDTAALFGGPQDVEWAIDGTDRLWLLQSRPVTAVGHAAEARGPVLGPGPVGETFPDPLRRLERDLFLAPLRIGMIEALRAIGVVPHRAIADSPVVTTVGGRVAADLELLGWWRRPRGWGVLNPVPAVRRSVAAWHVGRLRRALPHLSEEVVRRTDLALRAVPALDGLTDDELLALLGRTREELIRVHGYQMLAGMLLPAADDRPSASTLALAAIAASGGEGVGGADLDDAGLIAAAPVVLALLPPRIGPRPALPRPTTAAGPSDAMQGANANETLGPREALRLRARWLDELAARIAWTVATRLVARRRIPAPEEIAHLSLRDLAAALADPRLPIAAGPEPDPVPPLPAAFRLTPAGEVVPVAPARGHRTHTTHPPGGRGAVAGRAIGPVRHEGTPPGPGDVLVVRVLSPSLAGVLPSLGALVSETGSTLSHLAILARELGIPTVVGLVGALDRYPEGTVVVVDGGLGEVRPAEDRTGAET